MVERAVHVLIALALAGLAWLSAGWTQGHHADLMRFGGPGHWLQWPALVSGTRFQLPEVPTTGNGRDTPLGSTVYSDVTNGRIGLNTNRPDLVTVYTGRNLVDALCFTGVVSKDGNVLLYKPIT